VPTANEKKANLQIVVMTKLINFLIKNFQYKEAKINSNSRIVKGKIREYQILDNKNQTANSQNREYQTRK